MSKAYLTLACGDVFEGEFIGAACSDAVVGELVFSTAMVGYLETLTDPSYFGQVVMQTFPLIGNYGVISEDAASERCYCKAYIVRELCQDPSNFRCEGDLDTFLKEKGITGICGVDTRAITRILRKKGTMNCAIAAAPVDPETLKAYRVEGGVAAATSAEVSVVGEGDVSVALMDYGTKKSSIEQLTARGCRVTLYPAGTAAEDVIAAGHDGIMLSDGPGDPTDNGGMIAEIAKLMAAGKPVFGVGLGHQMMALSQGAGCVKLPFGHHGASQPVVVAGSSRVYITSQNHNFAVDGSTLPEGAKVTYYNANDKSCEGAEYANGAFGVQFTPDTNDGPQNSGFLFDRFVTMMKEGK
ncbi:MAG: carbamoyl phosphate synthase small subunit [Clostridia bacterium]|nr:carbamoyl phosphate synthase small subunit [Clostridia bacterium]